MKDVDWRAARTSDLLFGVGQSHDWFPCFHWCVPIVHLCIVSLERGNLLLHPTPLILPDSKLLAYESASIRFLCRKTDTSIKETNCKKCALHSLRLRNFTFDAWSSPTVSTPRSVPRRHHPWPLYNHRTLRAKTPLSLSVSWTTYLLLQLYQVLLFSLSLPKKHIITSTTLVYP